LPRPHYPLTVAKIHPHFREAALGSEPQVNLFDLETQKCPYPAYKQLRDEAPVYNIAGTDMWVVTRYDTVREVLMDPQRFPSSAP